MVDYCSDVENLELISPLVPLKGDEVWKDGQVILTTQNTNAAPQDSISTKHISLIHGMNDQDCRQLLALYRSTLSCTEVDDPLLLEEVAEKLDRQPLAMAAAAVYMKQVIKSSPDFSWRDYLGKLEKGKRGLTEKRLQQINSAAYSSTMSTAVLLAVEKCTENNTILKHAFNLFSLISFEPLPLDLVVIYIRQQDIDIDVEDILLEMQFSSLFLHVGNEEKDVRLHRVVHDAIKTFCGAKALNDTSVSEDEIPNKKEKMNSVIYMVLKTMVCFFHRKDKIKLVPHLKAFHEEKMNSVIYMVLKTMVCFFRRKDKIKLVPHLKAFHKEIKRMFPKQALHSICSNFDSTEISQMYLFFGKTLRYFSELNLSMEFQHEALKVQLEQAEPNLIDVADSYDSLGNVYSDKGDLEQN
ncbi:uncharacterized protein LOC114535744 [Dendronephthya gigantea]|uniref:uncharacterized protein LOC114535744 n=1 Tax=Dendronephthya gigantea TaxID=151771 RepID=UPI001069DF09|nr:uncharacterized protein LOC114535744 [Dendronephthya gigantea]